LQVQVMAKTSVNKGCLLLKNI